MGSGNVQLELRCVSGRTVRASQLLQFLHTAVRQPLTALQAVLSGLLVLMPRSALYSTHAAVRQELTLQVATSPITTVRVSHRVGQIMEQDSS